MSFDATAPASAMLSHEIKPFASTERAWLRAVGCLVARRAGKPTSHDNSKTCPSETTLACFDRLYRAGQIDLVHARIQRLWGDRGGATDPCGAPDDRTLSA